MTEAEQIIRESYAAFNAGDLAKAAAYIAETVEWPNQMDGGMLHNRGEVVAYWVRILETLPHEYEVKHCATERDGVVTVTLIRTVLSPEGTVFSRGLLRHRYTFRDSQVVRMEILL